LLELEVCATFRRSEPEWQLFAGIAQLVEQLICNQQVVGSNPSAGSVSLRFASEVEEVQDIAAQP
jgi:hypothetical protein